MIVIFWTKSIFLISDLMQRRFRLITIAQNNVLTIKSIKTNVKKSQKNINKMLEQWIKMYVKNNVLVPKGYSELATYHKTYTL